MHVLFIHVDHSCEILVQYLRICGLRVFSTHPSDEALSLARIRLPGVIVIDLVTRRRRGMDMVRAFAEDEATFAIPLICLVGPPPAGRTLKRYGVTDYIASPIDPETVLSRLTTAISTGE